MVLAHNILEGQRTKDVQITKDVTFDTMLLSQYVLSGLKDSGFLKPSPIQLQGIPLGKCGFDLLLEAKSGTGKTAVFTVIALENLKLNNNLQVIILAPTREIASQICDVIKHIGRRLIGLCVEVVMGGLPIQEDINKFKEKTVHIVVGSPGRLKHLIHDHHIDLSSVSLFILDEADKLVEKSFLPDIKYIFSALPMQKQVILSSATYPESCREFINLFVYGAQHICPNTDSILLGVAQRISYVKFSNNIVKQTEIKYNELLNILSKKQFKQCLIFCNYQTRVEELHKKLTRKNWPVEQLYGRQEQLNRLGVLKTFQEYNCRLLISTDLGARGIDSINVDLVINYEAPYEWQTYLHRIGRAGRFGSYGMAVTIVTEGQESEKFMNILKILNLSDILPMWSQENVQNNVAINIGHEIKLKNDTEGKENYLKEHFFEKIWNSISDEQEIVADENVQNFSELITSYSESRFDNVESFSDLLTSFQNINVSVHYESQTDEYKTVVIPEILDANCISGSLKTIKNNVIQNFEIENHNELKYVQEISNEHKNETCKLDKTQTEPHKIQKVYSCNINYNKLMIGSTETITSENNTTYCPKAENLELVKLGLPSCFSNFKNKYKCNKESTTLYGCSTSQNKYNSHYVSNKETRNKKEIRNYHRFSYRSESKGSTRVDHGSKNLKDANNSYSNWYNQLKLRVQQIEQAIYIDELSKL